MPKGVGSSGKRPGAGRAAPFCHARSNAVEQVFTAKTHEEPLAELQAKMALRAREKD